MPKEKEIPVIILASGKGERMKPYTDKKNKCMFKINNEPLLKCHVDHLKYVGFNKIFITTFWKAEEIIKTFESDNEVIIYKEDGLTGSATAVINIMNEYNLKRVCVIYGDTYYYNSYYNQMRWLFDLDGNYIMVQNSDSYNSGLILYDKMFNRIIKVSEKSKIKAHNQGIVAKQIGIVLLNNEFVCNGDIMLNLVPDNKDKFIVMPLSEPINRWCDIGEKERYIELILELYNSSHVQYLLKTCKDVIIKFVLKLMSAKRIFIAGNGGSLSTAEHFALDLSKCGKLNAIALNSPAHITAYGNDDGFENIFVNQLSKFNIQSDDVIILISGSGNSPNIVKVIESFPNNQILGMSGNEGLLKEKIELTLPVNSGNIRVIEDAHLSYAHAMTEIIDGLN